MTSKNTSMTVCICLLSFLWLISSTYCAMTILPNNYQIKDDYYLDDIANTDEQYKFFVMSNIMSGVTTSGYTDEYSGVYYPAAQTCLASEAYRSVTYVYNALVSNPTIAPTMTSTNLRFLYNQYVYYTKDTLYCPIRFFADNPKDIFYVNLKFINPSAATENFTVQFWELANGYTPLNPVDIKSVSNFPSKSTMEINFRFKVNGDQIDFWVDTDSYSTLHSTPGTPDRYFDNSNYVAVSFAIGINYTQPTPRSSPTSYVGLTAITIFNYVMDDIKSLSGNIYNDCSFNRGCVDGMFCDGNDYYCKRCDKQCKSCFTSASNNCQTCYPTSSSFMTTFASGTQCRFDFNDLTKFQNFSIETPAPLNYRVTIDFWMFIHNTKNLKDTFGTLSVSSIVLKDFFTLSFMQAAADTDVDIYFIPLETFYPLDSPAKNRSDFTAYFTLYPTIQYVKDTLSSSSSKWYFIRASFSYVHKLMYLNSVAPVTINPINFLTGASSKTLYRKFYRVGDTTSLNIFGFTGIQTEIYIRNLNIFNEYLPVGLDIKFFNIHKITGYSVFPQLFVSLPLDDLLVDSSSFTATTTFYDFSHQFGLNVSKQVIRIGYVQGGALKPPKNFKRIKFLAASKQYVDVDLMNITPITCSETLCFENNLSYSCSANKLLNISNFSCSATCPTLPIKYMRLPQAKDYALQEMCVYPCPTGSTCPNGLAITAFSCAGTDYTVNYQCLPKSSYTDTSSIQFSGTLKTRSMVIDLLSANSNFILEMWIHPDLLLQSNPPLQTSHLFVTDSHQIYYDASEGQYKISFIANGVAKQYDLNENLYYYGWNHLILANQPGTDGNTIISASLLNSFLVSTSTIASAQGVVSMRYICFLNVDVPNPCGTDSITWLDVWMSELKIWNGAISNVFSVIEQLKFSYVTPSGLIHYFPFSVSNINQNTIKDSLSTVTGVFPFDTQTPSFNPDKDIDFNFDWNISWNDFNPGKFATSASRNQLASVTVTASGNCDTACSMCYGISKFTCLKCNSGYALIGNTCTKYSDGSSYYFFMNPPKSAPSLFSLKISNFNLPSYPSITLFFFLKVYGFTSTATDTKLIIFNSISNFYLQYNGATFALELFYNSVLQFSYPNFISHFGLWVPISLAIFATPNASLQNNMSAMTVNYTQLPILDPADKTYQISEISFPRGFIGLISDITFFRVFIINAWGISQHFSSASLYTPNVIGTITMKSTSSGANCLTLAQMTPATAASGAILNCVEDYVPYTDQSCADTQLVKVSKVNVPATCIDDACKCTPQCIDSMNACDWTISTCDNISDSSIYVQLVYSINLSNQKTITCAPHNGLDLARYQSASVVNVQSPVDAFKMEFWFYSQSYVGNNFSSLTISWDFHIKILVKFDGSSFSVSCYSLINNAFPSNDGQGISFFYQEAVVTSKWRYAVCGVNMNTMKYYVTNLQKTCYASGTVTSPASTIPDSPVTIFISENSPVNYGVTYVKELRLWNCYDCNSQTAFILFDKSIPKFGNVIHYFKFEDPTGGLTDYVTGTSNTSISATPHFAPKINFNGYNVIHTVPPSPNCNEDGHHFYNLKSNTGCDTMYNFNRLLDVTFPDLPASRTNRWTLEFWFYVESPDDFTKGFNVIYEDHISISVITSSVTSNDIDVLCLPQAYRDKVLNQSGENIYNIFNASQNTAYDKISGGFSKWIFVRCAYNYNQEVFYLNSKHEQEVQPEVFFEQPVKRQNSFPFKFFHQNFVRLFINGCKLNTTRIFLQVINIYREYIPQSLDFRNMAMKYYCNLTYWPLLFSVDFKEDYKVSYNGLMYYYNDPDNALQKASSTFLYTFMDGAETRDYPTYPVYDDFLLCKPGKILHTGTCISINSSSPCDTSSTFCYDDNQYFWCPMKSYLIMNSLKCDTSCSASFTRSPDVPDGYGMCVYPCTGKYSYSKCPYSSTDLPTVEYSQSPNFECNGLGVKTYFKCASNGLIESSAFFFSNFYSFTNSMINYVSLNLKNYYVEFSFMYANISSFSQYTNTTIFVAHPHFISRSGDRVTYTNAYIKDQVFNITSIHKYEWNKVIIENYQTGTDIAHTVWNVRVYVNGNYESPDVIANQSSLNYDFSLSQIAFCSKRNSKYSSCIVGMDYSTEIEPIWDNAFYKNIRVWDYLSTSLYVLNSFDNLYSDYTKNLLSYHKMTVDTINGKSAVSEVGGSSLDLVSMYNYPLDYDNDARLNIATDFDFGYINSTFTISVTHNLTNTTAPFSLINTTYTASPCSEQCKRCFSSSPDDCYSCNTINGIDMVLVGKKCYDSTNFYLKTPTNNSAITPTFALDIVDLEKVNPLTITVFMKFFGEMSDILNPVPILYFYQDVNFLGWDNINKAFTILYNKTSVAFRYSKSREIIGKWTHFGISIYNSIPVEGSNSSSNSNQTFPHMINFMVGQDIVEPYIDFQDKLVSTLINFGTLTMTNYISALFSDLRIYSTYYLGTYGLAQDSKAGTLPDLFIEISMKSPLSSESGWSNCLDNSQVVGGAYSIGVNCVQDFNEYDSFRFSCENQTKQINLIQPLPNTNIVGGGYCLICDSTVCNSYCFNSGAKSCTCTYDSGLYWIRFERIISDGISGYSYYCEKPDSLNVAYYTPITVQNIRTPIQSAYIMEGWVYIYSYISSSDVFNFPGMDISWDKYSRIEVTYSEGVLKARCFPYVDTSNYLYQFSVSQIIQKNSWNFISCLVDLSANTVSINSLPPVTIEQSPPSNSSGFTKLVIRDYASMALKSSYGLALLRELRLWGARNYIFYDTSRLNLNAKIYTQLLHYFKSYFSPSAAQTDYMYDEVTGSQVKLSKQMDYIPGYSYVANYTSLVLCEEGEIYKVSNTTGKGSCTNYSMTDFYDNLLTGKNTTYSTDELLTRAKIIYQLSLEGFNFGLDGSFQLYSIISPQKGNSNSNLTLVDPIKSIDYCNKKGYPEIIDRYITCYCYGNTIGSYCQMNSDNYVISSDIYTLFWKKAMNTFTSTKSSDLTTTTPVTNILQALSYIIIGSGNFFLDSTFLLSAANNISLIYSQLNVTSISNDEINLLYFKLLDNTYSANVVRTNLYKAAALHTNAAHASSDLRNVPISYLQKSDIGDIFLLLRSSLESLSYLQLSKNEDSYFNYTSDNFEVEIFPIDQNFDFLKFFVPKKYDRVGGVYKMYFDMKNCVKSVVKRVYNTDVFKFRVIFITWFNPPILHEESLYWNYTSPYFSIKVYDLQGNQVAIDNCTDTTISFYLNLHNPSLVTITNSKAYLLQYGNIYPPSHRIFTNPYFIEDNGHIQNTTRAERIDQYYLPIRMDFNYFNGLNQSFSNSGLTYFNYSSDNYFICNSTHLTDFILNYRPNELPWDEESRLYFFKYPMIFAYFPNYAANYGFFLCLFIVLAHIVGYVILKVKQTYYVKARGYEAAVELQLMKYVYPYGNLEDDYIIDPFGNKIPLEDDNNVLKGTNNDIFAAPVILPVEKKIALTSNNQEENKNKNNNRKKKTKSSGGSDSKDNHNEEVNINTINTNNKNVNPEEESKIKGETKNKKSRDEHEDQELKDEEGKSNVGTKRGKKRGDISNNRPKNEVDAYDNDILVIQQNIYGKGFKTIPKKNKEGEEIEEDKLTEGKNMHGQSEEKLKENARQNTIERAEEGKVSPDRNSLLSEKEENRHFNDLNSEKVYNNYLEYIDKGTKSKAKAKEKDGKELKKNLEVYNLASRVKLLQDNTMSFLKFFWTNFTNRNIFITSLANVTVLYPAGLKMLYLTWYLTVLLFLNTLIYVFNGSLTYPEIFSNLVFFLLYSIIPVFGTNLTFFLISLMFYVGIGKVRLLLHHLKEHPDIFRKEWGPIVKTQSLLIKISTVAAFALWLVTFFLSFALCAVYYNQGLALILSFVSGIAIDFVCCLGMELIIALIYLCRQNRNAVQTLDFLNRLKSYKTLSP